MFEVEYLKECIESSHSHLKIILLDISKTMVKWNPIKRETQKAKILNMNQIETFWLRVWQVIEVYKAAYPVRSMTYYTTDEWNNPQWKPMFKPEDLQFIS